MVGWLAVEDDVVAKMNVRGLVKSGVIAGFFPIHDSKRVKDLEWNWVRRVRE